MVYFIIQIKKNLMYRWQIIFKILSTFIVSISTVYLWRYIYMDNINMQNYMVRYTIISTTISTFYTAEISESISKKIYDGTFVVDLVRPVSFFKINIMQSISSVISNSILKLIPLGGVFWLFYKEYIYIPSFYNIIIFVIALAMAFWLHTSMYAILGFLAFKFYEVWPFNRLLGDTIKFFSGAFIPIYLFPNWVAKISDLLPFQYLYSFLIELILKKKSLYNIIIELINLLLWNIIMEIILFIVYKKTIDKCVVQGG